MLYEPGKSVCYRKSMDFMHAIGCHPGSSTIDPGTVVFYHG